MPPTTDAKEKPPIFVAGDLDGFFGLALDNLIQFLVILGLVTQVIGVDVEHVLGVILPGAALSIVVGNVFYSWQALELMKKTGRRDVTALPYGINTVSLFAYVFLVMLPVKLEALARGMSAEEAALVAWQVGLGACLVSAIIEIGGAFVADRIRKATPRAALLATLAGIAISFIAIDFAVQTFESPLVAFLPLAIILTTYFGRIKLPFRVPGGAWAVIAGTALAWLLFAFGSEHAPVDAANVATGAGAVSFYFPLPVFGDLVAGMTHPLFFDFLVPVMLPMGLFNVLGSLQNIESAEAAGDSYPALPSMLANGIGSAAAAVFGSCFPTTIYIGHPGWKALGARAGYSVLNGIFFAVVALFGLTSLVGALVPMQAGIAIVLWIGIVITAQAFQSTPKEHAPAVAFGLFPAIAGFGLMVLGQAVNAAGNFQNDMELAGKVLADRGAFARAGVHLDGLVALSQGFMLTCMIWSAACALLIDRRFLNAALWMGIGAVLSFFGFMHAGDVGPAGGVFDIGFGTGWPWAIGYALCGGFFAFVHVYRAHTGTKSDDVEHA